MHARSVQVAQTPKQIAAEDAPKRADHLPCAARRHGHRAVAAPLAPPRGLHPPVGARSLALSRRLLGGALAAAFPFCELGTPLGSVSPRRRRRRLVVVVLLLLLLLLVVVTSGLAVAALTVLSPVDVWERPAQLVDRHAVVMTRAPPVALDKALERIDGRQELEQSRGRVDAAALAHTGGQRQAASAGHVRRRLELDLPPLDADHPRARIDHPTVDQILQVGGMRLPHAGAGGGSAGSAAALSGGWPRGWLRGRLLVTRVIRALLPIRLLLVRAIRARGGPRGGRTISPTLLLLWPSPRRRGLRVRGRSRRGLLLRQWRPPLLRRWRLRPRLKILAVRLVAVVVVGNRPSPGALCARIRRMELSTDPSNSLRRTTARRAPRHGRRASSQPDARGGWQKK